MSHRFTIVKIQGLVLLHSLSRICSLASVLSPACAHCLADLLQPVQHPHAQRTNTADRAQEGLPSLSMHLSLCFTGVISLPCIYLSSACYCALVLLWAMAQAYALCPHAFAELHLVSIVPGNVCLS